MPTLESRGKTIRYICEAVDLLACPAPTLRFAVAAAPVKAYVILDGAQLPIDRIAADRPYHAGKHKRHGMNVHVLADPLRQLIWTSPRCPAVHDMTGAPTHGIIDALAAAGVRVRADKGYFVLALRLKSGLTANIRA